MPYVGRLEERPLLDIIQIVAYSGQSGLLTVDVQTARAELFDDERRDGAHGLYVLFIGM